MVLVMLRRLVALVEIVGGLALVAHLGPMLFRGRPTPAMLAVVGLLVLLGLMAIWAGVGLWRGHRGGAVLSGIWFALQLPHLMTGPLTYFFFTPATVAVGLGDGWVPHAVAWFGPQLEITPNDFHPETWIGVNLLAVTAIAVIALGRCGRAPGARTEAARASPEGGEPR